jgi:signal transduction histidine kinase
VLRIALRDTDGMLTFEVADDGTGFDPTDVAAGGGIASMSDRVEGFGGTLEIASGSAGGSVVRGQVPSAPGPTGAPQTAASER